MVGFEAFISQTGQKFFLGTKMNTSPDTLIDASRPLSSIDAVIAEMALLSHLLLRIELHHSKRTRLDTSLASDAGFWINQNNAVGSLRDRVNCTSFLTRRL